MAGVCNQVGPPLLPARLASQHEATAVSDVVPSRTTATRAPALRATGSHEHRDDERQGGCRGPGRPSNGA
jgi:hypothetical protein